jgi:hypothetical protein
MEANNVASTSIMIHTQLIHMHKHKTNGIGTASSTSKILSAESTKHCMLSLMSRAVSIGIHGAEYLSPYQNEI